MNQFLTPWSATVHDRTLIVTFSESYRVLSWAPLNGGFCQARSILNHQVRTEEYPAEEPAAFLAGLAGQLAIAAPVVGLMTGGRWCCGTAALAPCFLIRWAGVLAMAPLSRPIH